MPSRISFTFRDRGFWAPSSMPVSIPKAAWGREGAEVIPGGGGRGGKTGRPSTEPGAVQLETQALHQGFTCRRHGP